MSDWKRVAVVSDSHGDMIDEGAAKIALDAIDDFNPHYRVHLGDFIDFRPLRGGASSGERADGFAEDVRAGLEFLDRFRPTHLTLGNHDHRAWVGSRDAVNGVLRDACETMVKKLEGTFEKMNLKWIPWGSHYVLEIGGFRFLHGYKTGIYAARQHAMEYGSCAFGHTHRPNEWRGRHYDHQVGINVGCLCEPHMEYGFGNTASLEKGQGFLLMVINEKTGQFRWQNVVRDKIDGTWAIPNGWKIIEQSK